MLVGSKSILDSMTCRTSSTVDELVGPGLPPAHETHVLHRSLSVLGHTAYADSCIRQGVLIILPWLLYLLAVL